MSSEARYVVGKLSLLHLAYTPSQQQSCIPVDEPDYATGSMGERSDERDHGDCHHRPRSRAHHQIKIVVAYATSSAAADHDEPTEGADAGIVNGTPHEASAYPALSVV